MILPGATLGMLGGGQLGRMFTVAARTMGYRVIVLDPDPDSPAGRIADEHLHAAYEDPWALDQMARDCAVVTTEFENVPAATLERLARDVPVRPSAKALSMAQNRIREKRLIRALGLATAPYAEILDEESLDIAAHSVPMPAILKRAEMGYDGKGQVLVHSQGELKAAYETLGRVPCVLERRVDLEREISVVLARGLRGEITCFPVAENEHQGGILFRSSVPARVSDALAEQARGAAALIAHGLEYCGVLAVEFFVTAEGALLVNEIAPRPHNSGHYTLDVCITSQFEQQVRMICELPAGDTAALSPVVMVNLLGDLWEDGPPRWERLFADPRAKLHLYGKRVARPGRKMGHFCYVHPDLETARGRALEIHRRLGAPE
jgi:5-(carboxyamino)imidazole ribonucleotide synthase